MKLVAYLFLFYYGCWKTFKGNLIGSGCFLCGFRYCKDFYFYIENKFAILLFVFLEHEHLLFLHLKERSISEVSICLVSVFIKTKVLNITWMYQWETCNIIYGSCNCNCNCIFLLLFWYRITDMDLTPYLGNCNCNLFRKSGSWFR